MNRSYSGKIVNARIRAAQGEVMRCAQRFKVLAAGRRFGKTEIGNLELVRAACGRGRKVWYVAPTYNQAKRIVWTRLKELARAFGRIEISETDLRIQMPWDATIEVRGADNYDSLRGEGLDFVVLDEYADMRPEVWPEVLRPALSDRSGGALFTGTPKGFNHFYELFDKAGREPDWAAFQFTTEQGGNVSAEELRSASRELDERTYRQEFQASFETLGSGRVYYAFDRASHVRPLAGCGKRAFRPHLSGLAKNNFVQKRPMRDRFAAGIHSETP